MSTLRLRGCDWSILFLAEIYRKRVCIYHCFFAWKQIGQTIIITIIGPGPLGSAGWALGVLDSHELDMYMIQALWKASFTESISEYSYTSSAFFVTRMFLSVTAITHSHHQRDRPWPRRLRWHLFYASPFHRSQVRRRCRLVTD